MGQTGTPHDPVRIEVPYRKHGKANPYLKAVLGEAAISAAKTDTFLGERYRRLVRRRSGISSQTRTPASMTSAQTSTTNDSTTTAKPATLSTNSKRSATK